MIYDHNKITSGAQRWGGVVEHVGREKHDIFIAIVIFTDPSIYPGAEIDYFVVRRQDNFYNGVLVSSRLVCFTPLFATLSGMLGCV